MSLRYVGNKLYMTKESKEYEIEKINNMEIEILNYISKIRNDVFYLDTDKTISGVGRWSSIAKIDIEKGFMELKREIIEIPEFKDPAE